MTPPAATSAPQDGLHASDVVAFGQEFGRVLSDGRIVGRAEPFAKVFPSSRAVKRAVGVTAWAILEDIALDARVDVEGRLVADTNVRRIGDNLGMSKNTVARHLARLRDHGFVLHEEVRADSNGHYATSRYVLDPSACLERFTHTPPTPDTGLDDRSTDRPGSSTEGSFGPCTNSWDTVTGTVSQSTGHRGLGHNKDVVVLEEEQQQQGLDDELSGRLAELGVEAAQADRLLAEFPPTRVRAAVNAASTAAVRNPAGWVVAAVTRGWDLTGDPTHRDGHAPDPSSPRRPTPPPVEPPAPPAPLENGSAPPGRDSAWASAAAAVLSDGQLQTLVTAELSGALAGFAVTSPRILRARIAGRVAGAHLRHPDLPLVDALALLDDLADVAMPDELPPCPRHRRPEVDLEARLRPLLDAASASAATSVAAGGGVGHG